jgi:hypothetical protein
LQPRERIISRENSGDGRNIIAGKFDGNRFVRNCTENAPSASVVAVIFSPDVSISIETSGNQLELLCDNRAGKRPRVLSADIYGEKKRKQDDKKRFNPHSFNNQKFLLTSEYQVVLQN